MYSFRVFLLTFLVGLFFSINAIAEDPVLEEDISRSTDLDSSAVGHYLSADYAFRKNEPEESARLFIEALKKSPDNPALLQSVYKLLLFSGHIDESVEYIKKYIKHDKKSVSANIVLAIHAINSGNFEYSDKILEKISYEKVQTILSGVDLVIVPFLRMWTKVGLGDHKEALKISSSIKKSSEVQVLFINYQNALINDIAGYHKKADEEYEISLSGRKSPYHFVKAAGNFYERIGKSDKAKELYMAYRSRYPQLSYFGGDVARVDDGEVPGTLVNSPADGVVEVLMEAVRVLYKSGLYRESLAYLQLILYLDPDNIETKILLASYYEEFEKYDQAVALYEQIPVDSDFYWASRINMAEDLYNLDEKKRASDQLIALSKRNPDNYSALLILGDLLRKDSKFREASKIYTKIIESFDGFESHHWPVFFARGICYERSNEWPKAEKDLLKALELHSGQPEVLNYLGYSWIDRNENIDQAKEMVVMAVKARPNDPQIIDSMGWVLYKLKSYDEASEYLERAVELMPKDPIINDHLGDVYWKMGRRIEAKFQWERTLKFNEGDIDEEQLKRKISRGL